MAQELDPDLTPPTTAPPPGGSDKGAPETTELQTSPAVPSAPAAAVGTGYTAAGVPTPDTGYTDAGVPTLEGVRDKIETRYATALGATELAEETSEVRTAEQQYAARQKAAADKLEEIRSSMHKPE